MKTIWCCSHLVSVTAFSCHGVSHLLYTHTQVFTPQVTAIKVWNCSEKCSLSFTGFGKKSMLYQPLETQFPILHMIHFTNRWKKKEGYSNVSISKYLAQVPTFTWYSETLLQTVCFSLVTCTALSHFSVHRYSRDIGIHMHPEEAGGHFSSHLQWSSGSFLQNVHAKQNLSMNQANTHSRGSAAEMIQNWTLK